MPRSMAFEALHMIHDYDDMLSIGGGEPTLHPDFFDVLRRSLETFTYIWMATNGSKTKIMWRLANIINGDDYDEKNEYDGIYQDGKLTVALSLDSFHDPINPKIEAYWKQRANTKGVGFEVRDTTRSYDGIVAQGRAKKTGSGWNEDACVCSDLFIRPDGKIKLCGCTGSPIIGTVRDGIEDKWEKVMRSESFTDTRCFKALKRKQAT
jgi:MoaA/NifB/PqqE/SkfB family radical SAM enzyme